MALEQVEKQTGIRPPELDGPECPDAVEYLWKWFIELDNARGGNGFGLNPISYTELLAWATMTRANPSPWEVATLKRIDALFLSQDDD